MKKMIVFVAVLAVASYASAESVNINNFSFEEPVLDPGGWTNTYPDWAPPENSGDAFVEYIDGFSSDGNQHIGLANQAIVAQGLGVELSPNTTYELTVGIGNRNGSFTPTDGTQASTFGLSIPNTADVDCWLPPGCWSLTRETVDAGPLGPSTFADFSLTYTTTNEVRPGELLVVLENTGNGRSHFDNIRLTATAIPEPSSLVLLSLSGLALGALRRRRR